MGFIRFSRKTFRKAKEEEKKHKSNGIFFNQTKEKSQSFEIASVKRKRAIDSLNH